MTCHKAINNRQVWERSRMRWQLPTNKICNPATSKSLGLWYKTVLKLILYLFLNSHTFFSSKKPIMFRNFVRPFQQRQQAYNINNLSTLSRTRLNGHSLDAYKIEQEVNNGKKLKEKLETESINWLDAHINLVSQKWREAI